MASVTLGDEEARTRGTQKSVLERKGPPTFPIVVEMRDRGAWVAHDTSDSVDTLLKTKIPKVQVGFVLLFVVVGGCSSLGEGFAAGVVMYSMWVQLWMRGLLCNRVRAQGAQLDASRNAPFVLTRVAVCVALLLPLLLLLLSIFIASAAHA